MPRGMLCFGDIFDAPVFCEFEFIEPGAAEVPILDRNEPKETAAPI